MNSSRGGHSEIGDRRRAGQCTVLHNFALKRFLPDYQTRPVRNTIPHRAFFETVTHYTPSLH